MNGSEVAGLLRQHSTKKPPSCSSVAPTFIPQIPMAGSPQGLRVGLHCQSHWDDKNHVTYLSDLDNGECPECVTLSVLSRLLVELRLCSTHPIATPHLFCNFLGDR